MKKFITLILALALLVSLCACGGKTDASAPESSAPSSEVSSEVKATPTPTPTPEPESSEEPEETSSEPEESEPEEYEWPVTPTDEEYTGTRGPDDPNVLYGIWNGQVKMIELDSGYDQSEIIKLTARFDYDEDQRGYFKAWSEDENDPILFVYMEEDPDRYWRHGIRTDYARPVIGDNDCWIMDHIMNDDHDGSTYSVVVNNGLISTLCDHDYVDADGNRFELQFDFEKDTSATMD